MCQTNNSMKALRFFVSNARKATRHLFLKDNPSNDCALTIANIPPFMTTEHLELFFHNLIDSSQINSILIKKSTSVNGSLTEGYRNGTILFKKESDCRSFFNKCENLCPISLETIGIKLPNFGINDYVKEYNSKFVSVEELLITANEVVSSYEERMKNEKEEDKLKTNVPDNDGWITVTRNYKKSFRETTDNNNLNHKATAVTILQKEFKQLKKNPVEGFEVSLPNENNLLHWKVAIFGPPDTLYQGGYFKAELFFPQSYPFLPPKMRFISPIWHPNIYRSGEICISILHSATSDELSTELPNERWNPALGVRTILISVISMLSEPNTSSPANVDASIQYQDWKEKRSNNYETIIKTHVEKSKILAEKDGISVPQNTEDYLEPGKKNIINEAEEIIKNDIFAAINDDDEN